MKSLNELINVFLNFLNINKKDNIKKHGFNKDQIKEIRLGLEKGLKVSLYADTCFNAKQMRQLRYGLEDKLKIKWYTNPRYDYKQMEQIRNALLDRLNENDLEEICKYENTHKDMFNTRKYLSLKKTQLIKEKKN